MLLAARYGSDVIVDLLKGFGIQYAALNPGATYRGLHDSIVNYGGNCPEIVTCTHEEIAVAIAHGYTKVTGKPMAAIVHDVVGLLHSSMAIYYAHIDRVPVLVLGATGPLDRSKRRPYIDWIHSALVQGNAVRDFVKWDDQPASVADFAPSFARGYRIATTEPAGPVYLCYDAGLQEDELERPVSVKAEVEAALPTAPQADPAALADAADRIAKAERPVIVAEYTGRDADAFREVAALAELIGAPVIDLQARLNIATRHPLNFTGSEAMLNVADLILALDMGDLFRALNRLDRTTHEKQSRIRAGCAIVQIGLMELRSSKWSEDIGQFQPVDLSIVADTRLALPALRAHLSKLQSPKWAERRARLEKHNAGLRADVEKQSRLHWDDSPIWPARLASEVWEAIKGEDWVLTGADLEDWAPKLWDIDSPVRWPGRSLGTAHREHPARRRPAVRSRRALDRGEPAPSDARGHVQQPRLLQRLGAPAPRRREAGHRQDQGQHRHGSVRPRSRLRHAGEIVRLVRRGADRRSEGRRSGASARHRRDPQRRPASITGHDREEAGAHPLQIGGSPCVIS